MVKIFEKSSNGLDRSPLKPNNCSSRTKDAHIVGKASRTRDVANANDRTVRKPANLIIGLPINLSAPDFPHPTFADVNHRQESRQQRQHHQNEEGLKLHRWQQLRGKPQHRLRRTKVSRSPISLSPSTSALVPSPSPTATSSTISFPTLSKLPRSPTSTSPTSKPASPSPTSTPTSPSPMSTSSTVPFS